MCVKSLQINKSSLRLNSENKSKNQKKSKNQLFFYSLIFSFFFSITLF
nr:MAG TPA: hypothetical protein [Caudoviricetes sp.]DAT05378.1 MAG TPA: hypothetical protein [Caudoviricetes sp.]